MDTSEEQVFLFIENQHKGTPYGNLYISDEKGRSFTLSISNVIKSSAVDFEKINSLDGTFVINRYNRDFNALAKPNMFTENDIFAEEEKKSRLTQTSSTDSSRQTQTSDDVHREELAVSITMKEVEEDMRTYITHNKGAKWELIQSPLVTSKGAPINCYV